jgi:hypothetical protein
MTPDERAQKAAAKLIGMGATFEFRFSPSITSQQMPHGTDGVRTDRLEGLRATELTHPPLPVAILLERGNDTLPCQRHVWMVEQQTKHTYCHVCGAHKDQPKCGAVK